MSTNPKLVRSVADSWKAASAALSLTEERQYSTSNLSVTTGLNQPSAGRALRFLRGMGLLTYRSEYPKGSSGQHVYMQLLKPLDEGMTLIYKHFDAGRSYSWFEAGEPGGGPTNPGFGRGKSPANTGAVKAPVTVAEPVVVADERSTEEVRAIAGPEPESPMASLRSIRKDEPEALIEAARQYANRTSEVTAHIEALRGLGVEVDMDKVMAGISLTPDPELELVGRLLPYIDRLERSAKTARALAESNRGDLAEYRRSVSVLTKERNDLQAANKRLSERNVKLQGAQVQSQAQA